MGGACVWAYALRGRPAGSRRAPSGLKRGNGGQALPSQGAGSQTRGRNGGRGQKEGGAGGGGCTLLLLGFVPSGLFLFLKGRVLLCSPGTHYVDLAGLELRNLTCLWFPSPATKGIWFFCDKIYLCRLAGLEFGVATKLASKLE